jgi:hypothetical protein
MVDKVVWDTIRKYADGRWEGGVAEYGDTWKERDMYDEAKQEVGDLFNYLRKQGEKTTNHDELTELMVLQTKVVEIFDIVTKMDEKYNRGA